MSVLITIPQGQSVRDVLILPFLKHLRKNLPEVSFVLLSPAHNVPSFRALIPDDERLIVRRMETPVNTGHNARVHSIRRRVGLRLLKKWLIQVEAKRFIIPSYLKSAFEQSAPRIVISTHPMPSHDYEVFLTAHKLGIPTIGIVKSWDNIGKGLACQTDYLSVWNSVNFYEAIEHQGFEPSSVAINGSLAFDAYYDESWWETKEAFCASAGLDPTRPIITYATSGVYDLGFYGRDETHLAEDLGRVFSEVSELHDAQLVIRLHPASRLEYFWKYRNSPDTVLSFASYMPALGWYTDARDMRHQINLLRHSDVIVTPGSSWTIEASIFGTPVIVPVYSELQPDHAKAQFDNYTLSRHFKKISDNAWVPIAYSYLQLRNELRDAIQDPDKHRRGRDAIVENYVHFRDSNSAGRTTHWISTIYHEV